MNKSFKVVAAAALLATGSLANAAVLDFQNAVYAATVPNNVPLTVPATGPTDPSGQSGFVDDFYNYDGFTFQYQTLPNVPLNHAWIWLREGSTAFGGLEQVYNSGVASNGFLAHGCVTVACNPVYSDSLAIVSSTPFFLQSIDVARYYSDSVTFKLYTNVGDSTPAATFGVGATSPGNNYIPQTVLNPTASQAYSKIVVNGMQGYYGVDNIVYAPIPEPSTYAMVLAGLVAVGAVVRRRQSKG